MMKTILMQGDSITDAGRDFHNDDWRGQGYPTLVAAKIGRKYPAQYKIINRGVSGDRSVDLYARIKRDVLNLNPDYMSVLIGVNDVWHELSDDPNGVDNDKYFRVYCSFIEEVKNILPDIKIIILAPYVLDASATHDHWDVFSKEVAKRNESAKKVAEKYGLECIDLQKIFDDALKNAPADYWTLDGVHPTAFGHQLIADVLVPAFEKNF